MFNKYRKEKLLEAQRELQESGRKILELEQDRVRLKQEVQKIREELEDVKLQKRMEEREIKQLVKMEREAAVIEGQKKDLERAEQYAAKEMALQTKYHEQVMAQVEKARTELKDIYTAIMERLPNVNMEIGRETVRVSKEG